MRACLPPIAALLLVLAATPAGARGTITRVQITGLDGMEAM